MLHQRKRRDNSSINHWLDKLNVNGLAVPIADWDEVIPAPKLNIHVASILVFLIAVACFSNSCSGDFVFDDQEAVINNQDVRPDAPLHKIFEDDFWGSKLKSKTSHKSYRPITVLTFRLNYYMSGALVPWVFHCTNIVLHGVVCALLLRITSALLGGVRFDAAGEREFAAPRSSLLATLLFALHPIHTESVAAVVGRAELLCALFFLLSFLCYIRSCYSDIEYAVISTVRPPTYSVFWLLLSVTFSFLSMLSKEQGITVIGVCAAYDVIVVCRVDFLSSIRPSRPSSEPALDVSGSRGSTPTSTPRGTPKNSPMHVRKEPTEWRHCLLHRLAVLTLCAVAMLVLRWQIMGSAPPNFQCWDNPAAFSPSLLTRFINYNYLYTLNAWLLLNPTWLCFDWSMGCVPLIESVWDPRILAVLVFWAVLGYLVWICVCEPPSEDTRLLMMMLAFLVVPFLPASNLFFTVGFVIAERVLYLPSIGYAMLFVFTLKAALHHDDDCERSAARRHVTTSTYNNNVPPSATAGEDDGCKAANGRGGGGREGGEERGVGDFSDFTASLVQVCTLFLLVVFFIRSVQRSAEWRNEELLFKAGERVCPLNAKVHYNIAKNTADAGNIAAAIASYREALRLNPRYDQAMNNLANILKDMGREMEAEQLLLRAVEIRAEFSAAWMNLGIVQAGLGKSEEALQSYFTAIKHRRKYPDCYYNLGNLYLEMKEHDKALKAWRSATILKPAHINAWNNMIILMDNLGKLKKAEMIGKEALKVLPSAPSVHFHLGNILGKLPRYVEAEQHFKKAIEVEPQNANYWGNLAVLYHRWEKDEKALEAYQKSLQLKPDLEQTRENLVKLQRKIAKRKL
ncbi:PREDICTED: transmembrane and TPR repeat-containing protein 4-like [Priapulus caudatus]|uniref:dolichyl-phosphate-mannose--protein mannosyltransferase n=1 Tax=Priapulus caudatus TaxID=37621 RepID=A0ABM1FAB7_PRICU|nr:PREDICTED: transmembrane and TPR repeat-containing protein 4-like [Priapulus caudatus]